MLKIDNEKLETFIDSEVKEVYKNLYTSTLQGWRYLIVMNHDENNSLYITGPLSSGSMPMDVYEGKASIVEILPSAIETDNDIITIDYIKEMKEEDKEKIFDYIKHNLSYIYEDDEDIPNSIDDITDMNIDFDSIFVEIFPEIYEEEKEKYIELNWEIYYRDSIIDAIDNAIEEINNCL